MIKDSSEYYNAIEQRRLEVLEKEQKELRERANAEWRDRWSTVDGTEQKHFYKKIVNAKIKIAPVSGEKIQDYLKRLKIYQTISHDKNWETHVDNGKRTWHTHSLPLGCFMCEDQQFITVCIQVMEILADNNKDYIF